MKVTTKLSLLAVTSAMMVGCSSSDNGGASNGPTAQVGLSASALDDSHRFDNPTSRVRVTVTEDTPGMLTYSVRFTNLTNNQPISPVAVVLHEAGYNAFIDGQTASTALEYMAEGGDNSFIITEAMGATQYLSHDATSGPVPPKSINNEVSITIQSSQADDVRMTVLGMLVNTNDAFTGLNAANVSNLAAGDVVTFNAPTWDAGTEANTETAASMPGPVSGGTGEGFNAARDDIIDRVRFHQGVVTNALAGI